MSLAWGIALETFFLLFDKRVRINWCRAIWPRSICWHNFGLTLKYRVCTTAFDHWCKHIDVRPVQRGSKEAKQLFSKPVCSNPEAFISLLCIEYIYRLIKYNSSDRQSGPRERLKNG